MPASILIIGNADVCAAYAKAMVNAGSKVELSVRDRESVNAKMPRTLYRYCVAL
ncbi:MAG: hypothetical protein QMD11_03370 [Smithella sp.]|nr:hypothetical protein [Smithella sp.]